MKLTALLTNVLVARNYHHPFSELFYCDASSYGLVSRNYGYPLLFNPRSLMITAAQLTRCARNREEYGVGVDGDQHCSGRLSQDHSCRSCTDNTENELEELEAKSWEGAWLVI